MGNSKNLMGMKFTRLTVISRMGSDRNKQALWECRCECGVTKVLPARYLKSGDTKSCGCFNEEKIKERSTKHGGKGSTEYRSWRSMIDRCTIKKIWQYEFYGGRGIKVCERWYDFENFINDMGEKPSPNHSIDRTDVNGDYEPSNCKWSTKTEQCRNRRVDKRNKAGISGVTWSDRANKWVVAIGLNNKSKHLGYFNDLQNAINARLEGEKLYWGKESS